MPSGANRWCYKQVTGLVEGKSRQIEVDGMAYSMSRVLLVERKPRITLAHVEELAAKKRGLE
jgi:hypothetical protein